MADRALVDRVYEEMNKIPLFDTHTHIDASHIAARDISDVCLYHMVISDLYSAGCPDGMRMSEDHDDSEVEYRITRAIPYYKYITNTSSYWGMKLILKNIYGWDEEITLDNWRRLDGIIREKNKNPNWGAEIFKKAGIVRACTELWRGHDGLHDELFQYSVEWAFFTRNQWQQFDTALLELEHAWNQDTPGAPLDVTTDRTKLNFKRTIKTIEDVDAALKHYCEKMPYDKIISTASHMSTDITYFTPSRQDMIEALAKRDCAGPKERDIYANYIFNAYLKEIQTNHNNIVLQFSFGAEPLPYEMGSKLRTETVFEVASLVNQYKDVKFNFFLSNLHQNQAMCTLAREIPNISLAAYWWFNFFPSIMRQVMRERLDMVAANKQLGFFSDAYCADWAYAKSIIVKKQLAEVFAEKIEQGQYTFEQAMYIANQILYTTPQELLGMKES